MAIGMDARDVVAGGALAGLRGTALVRRGPRQVLRVAGGTTGTVPDAPITRATRFQLASVSKQFTATAVLQCCDRGLVRLGDHVVDVLEGCPASWEPITLHQLLCHTAGLCHWPQLEGLDLCAPCEPAALLERFFAAPLVAAPGERYRYSSPGYVVLAHVVERATGEHYRDVLADEVFAPLGMHDTFVGSPRDAADVAAPCRGDDHVASFELDVVGMGAGDAWSTVDDLCRFDDALRDGTLLSDATRAAMWSPQAAMDEAVGGLALSAYGYAWASGTVDGRSIRLHTGDNPGFQALNAVIPELDARLVVLTNDETTDLAAVGLEALAVALAAR